MAEALHALAAPEARKRTRGFLAYAPALTVAVFLGPIAAGLLGTLLPAFGYLPALGGERFALAPWRALFAQPGFASALRLTLTTGLAATAASFLLASALAALLFGHRGFRRLEALLAPVLAAPHSAVAIGLAFLLAPSGWLVRLVSPWLSGWTSPPDIMSIGDPWGLALMLGLVVKEVPYLLLMMLAALSQVRAREHLAIAAALGYGRGMAWIKLVLPQLYPQIRLPLYAVLAFSLSVVDVALILGPGNPPPLAVLAMAWFSAPDLEQYFPAAAAACLLLLLVVAAIVLWRLGELGLGALGRRWIARGGRGGLSEPLLRLAAGAACVAIALAALGLVAAALWSLASTWRFPEALPDAWTLANWRHALGRLWWPASATASVGAAATALALALTLACLENEERSGRRAGTRALWLLYAPLLVPQIAFLFGAQVLLLRLGLDGSYVAVVWSHLLFVLPYVFLSLADPWRALDPRYARTAACLGASPVRIFFAIKLPLLLRPLLTAAAVGFAVSAGQYLPTLFAGAGRISTLTTEAVALAAGGDRRMIGVYAFLQSLLPLAGYAAALVLPGIVYANRRGLRQAG